VPIGGHRAHPGTEDVRVWLVDGRHLAAARGAGGRPLGRERPVPVPTRGLRRVPRGDAMIAVCRRIAGRSGRLSCDGRETSGQSKEAMHPVYPLRGVRRPLPFPLGPTAERSGPLAGWGKREEGGVRTTVLPWDASSLQVPITDSAVKLSSPLVGSSRNRMGAGPHGGRGELRKKRLCGISSASKQQPILILYQQPILILTNTRQVKIMHQSHMFKSLRLLREGGGEPRT